MPVSEIPPVPRFFQVSNVLFEESRVHICAHHGRDTHFKIPLGSVTRVPGILRRLTRGSEP